MTNPLKHFGINTQFIRGDTKSYNKIQTEYVDEYVPVQKSHFPNIKPRFKNTLSDKQNMDLYRSQNVWVDTMRSKGTPQHDKVVSGYKNANALGLRDFMVPAGTMKQSKINKHLAAKGMGGKE